MTTKKDKPAKPVDVFATDHVGDTEAIDADIQQIVAAPAGWVALIETADDIHTVPVACFALAEVSFDDNTKQTQIRAQVAVLHGQDFGHIIDAEDLDGYIGLVGPTQNIKEVIKQIHETLAEKNE